MQMASRCLSLGPQTTETMLIPLPTTDAISDGINYAYTSIVPFMLRPVASQPYVSKETWTHCPDAQYQPSVVLSELPQFYSEYPFLVARH
jgi:hypothetical protein